jgi:hypothetical protein
MSSVELLVESILYGSVLVELLVMERGFILVLVEVYEDVNTNFLLLGLAGASTISNIVSLQKLEIYYAYGFNSLPESFGNLTNLIDLRLNYTGLTKLPASFGKLTNLQTLDLGGKVSLELAYDSFTQLTSLREFHGDGCLNATLGPGFCSSRCVIEIPGNLGGKYFEGLKAEFGEDKDDGEYFYDRDDSDLGKDTDDGEDFDDSDDADHGEDGEYVD